MLEAANATSVSDTDITGDISNAVTPRDRRDDGERRLRRIARAGKHWKNTIGRPADMESESSFSFIGFPIPHSQLYLTLCSL